ncbi:hypothetical protein QYS49_16800 [Marivirga salinae]|uniref:Uncharacterized protein n=1 Tax=Marivirga salinarum TaxID=3059078 RepID=A0AA49GDI7_9BACT|nr:hypothetical protein [Marivirga sp. BDSF4-3]WKK73595.2 hypothetical protein QYS49_16800 [Marivirga sp. BDSF4-3]
MSFQQYAEYLTYISPIILCFGIIIGALYFNKLDKIHRVLWAYLIGCLIIDLSSRILSQLDNNNLVLFFVVGLLDLLIFTYIYYKVTKRKLIVLLIGIIGVIFIAVELIQTNVDDVQAFQEYSSVVVSFSIVSMSILLLTESLTHAKPMPQYFSFLNMACLVFFAFQLIFLLPLNFLINEDLMAVYFIWVLRIIFLFTFYSILTSLIWKNGKILK